MYEPTLLTAGNKKIYNQPSNIVKRISLNDIARFRLGFAKNELVGGQFINEFTATQGTIGAFNKHSNKCPLRRFNRRIKKANQLKRKFNVGEEMKTIVSDGDSWFQFPSFITDITDHLSHMKTYYLFVEQKGKTDSVKMHTYKIISLGLGGDWIQNMFAQDRLYTRIQEVSAHAILHMWLRPSTDVYKEAVRILRKYTTLLPGQCLSNWCLFVDLLCTPRTIANL